MAQQAQLGTCAAELATAAETLASFCQNSSKFSFDTGGGAVIPINAPDDVQRARRSIVENASKLQLLLGEPSDFLQRLCRQNQELACLRWLGEFQLLSCIPVTGSVAFKDVAELAGVPEAHFARVVRLMTTAGFLSEPQPGHVAHNALSSPFVTQPALLDAALFLSETAAPAALHMSMATRRFGNSTRSEECAWNVAFNTQSTFSTACDQRPRLYRQWPAFLRHGTNDGHAGVKAALMRLDWPSLGDAVVVDVGAPSTAIAMSIARQFPALRFVVQTEDTGIAGPWQTTSSSSAWGLPTPANSSEKLAEPATQVGSRITVHPRMPGSSQTVTHGAVYIIRLPSPSPSLPLHAVRSHIIAELRAHIEVLRDNPGSRLILVARILPAPGTVDANTESSARLRDLTLFQLANEREHEIHDLVEILNSVQDEAGSFFLTNELRSTRNAIVAFEVMYQHYPCQNSKTSSHA